MIKDNVILRPFYAPDELVLCFFSYERLKSERVENICGHICLIKSPVRQIRENLLVEMEINIHNYLFLCC